jgi:phage anti-repressor protein/Holliday junction resolvasome RuvABC endonuclease subunit
MASAALPYFFFSTTRKRMSSVKDTENTDMISFLKKFSTADNSFIDDFFSHIDINSPDDAHSVDLEFVSKWLNVRKGNLLKTLRASYILNVDYTWNKPKSMPGRGRNTLRIVMLTPDCFKTLCMQSKSPQADRVRAYFIAVEKTLLRYRLEIMNGMKTRILQLENNQRPKDKSLNKTGVVYVIRASDEHTVAKLGRSNNIVERIKLGYTNNISRRMQSHGSAKADALEVLFVYKTENMVAVEACAKGVLKHKQYRKYKEVYEVNMDIVKETIEGCGKLVSKVQQPISQIKRSLKGGTSMPRVFMIFSSNTL